MSKVSSEHLLYVQVTSNVQGTMNSLPALSFIYPLVFNNNNFSFSLETYLFSKNLLIKRWERMKQLGQNEPRET